MPSHTDIFHIIGFIGLLVVMLIKDRLGRRNGYDYKLYERLASVEERLAIQEKREIPPHWFEEKVKGIEAAVHDLGRNCLAHQLMQRQHGEGEE